MIADQQIKQKLENTKGVGEITIVGGAKREIHVQVDPDRLRAYNLTVTNVFNALKSQNLELPGGNLNAGAKEFSVRTTGRVPEVGAVQRDHGGGAGRPHHQNQGCRTGGGQLRGTAQRDASRWRAGGHPGGGQAVGREHGSHRRRSAAAAERDHPDFAERRESRR